MRRDARMVMIDDLVSGLRVRGLVAAHDVTVIAVERHGPEMVNVVFRADGGQIGDRLLSEADLMSLEAVADQRWTFDAPGDAFKLASEARLIHQAHQFDPLAAVATATVPRVAHRAVTGPRPPVEALLRRSWQRTQQGRTNRG